MTKEFWLNLPVKDPQKSKAFFEQLNFDFSAERESDTMVAMMVGIKKLPIMLFEENTFAAIVKHEVADTSKGSEMIISFDAESRQEVDEIAERVKNAGGNLFDAPAEIQGWMYGCAFADLDGHRWNVLYMDTAKIKG